jgi:hypothetical protein
VTDAAATAETAPDATQEASQGDATSQTEPQLGPEGEKALEAFKARARKAEKAEKELRERLDKIEEQNKSEGQKALDAARKEARAEAEAEFEKERRADRLAVAVAKRARDLADVDDVVLNLERRGMDGLYDEDGRIADKALDAQIESLLKDKPHLRAAGTGGRPQGTANGGEGESGETSGLNAALRKAAGY